MSDLFQQSQDVLARRLALAGWTAGDPSGPCAGMYRSPEGAWCTEEAARMWLDAEEGGRDGRD